MKQSVTMKDNGEKYEITGGESMGLKRGQRCGAKSGERVKDERSYTKG
jgi:hypothetical protein